MRDEFDLLIVGGGVNGAGIARDAAGRGLSVLLVEQDDLASYTSSASTKLIHGGLRYLEYGEFRLVREALIERELLWGMAPHIIWPARFVLPQTHSPRPAWMVRLGLFLYDHLGGRKKLPGTETIRLDRSAYGAGLADPRGTAFVYSDCRVDDSRLVVLNARDAADRGADIRTRTRLIDARREGAGWTATIADAGGESEVRARVLVNAAGPWVADVLARVPGARTDRGVRLVKGSHIIVPRLYEGDHAFMLQNADRRIVFTLPYEGQFTLIGTTDEPWEGAPARASIDAEETRYLLDTVNDYFAHRLGEADIVWSYAGIRPLYDDKAGSASAVTRDYVLDLDAGEGRAPMLSVFGGKITTYRKLAEHAMQHLARHLPDAGPAWTAGAALPGGDMPGADFDAFLARVGRERPDLPPALLCRLAQAYGTRIDALLGDAATLADLGEDIGGGLTVREVDYLVAHEWARTAEDVLWRRSKLGLHVPADTAERLAARLERGALSR
ncbi:MULTISPECIES: glycerol-3-phosphate dehydrogenase [unclassified Sphingomonas]|uniref:glycerol-3-phosphate dehydrogenase n=1 Tax=unclassified Sphingomonas TaxID=196159 RepID=UPI0009296DD0|nr:MULTISPECIES: glycerol-3-phosphate dehydrogenase [unclassified Sphingomonas]MBN8848853.1 glycerol-3-phosphate dehydrogenase [Sphingomonas sp.]OJV32864.1 MAG: glycerol-3-phosphate dehydrogenase [Sphingomonas sp. 67-36]